MFYASLIPLLVGPALAVQWRGDVQPTPRLVPRSPNQTLPSGPLEIDIELRLGDFSGSAVVTLLAKTNSSGTVTRAPSNSSRTTDPMLPILTDTSLPLTKSVHCMTGLNASISAGFTNSINSSVNATSFRPSLGFPTPTQGDLSFFNSGGFQNGMGFHALVLLFCAHMALAVLL